MMGKMTDKYNEERPEYVGQCLVMPDTKHETLVILIRDSSTCNVKQSIVTDTIT